MTRAAKWRMRLRREIEDEAVAARKSVARAKELATRKKQVVADDDGVPRAQPLTISEERSFIGYALTHLQEAENHFGQLRTLLTRYRERLESEHEIELAYADDLPTVDLNTKQTKPKRPPRAMMADSIKSAYEADVAEFGKPSASPWSRSLMFARIGKELNISPSTVRRYLKEELANA